jgi:hypothetical protein
VIERAVNYGVGSGRAAGECFRLLQIAAMNLGTGCFELPGTIVRTGEPKHLMAPCKQFRDDMRADESGRTSQEYAHALSP